MPMIETMGTDYVLQRLDEGRKLIASQIIDFRELVGYTL